MTRILETIAIIIISFIAVCIYFRFMKRAFDAFAKENSFPFDPLSSIINLMTIQVVAIVFALFLGSPFFQFTLDSFNNQLIFISIIIIPIGVMRLLNIMYHDAVNHDIVVWSCVATGVLAFNILITPGFIEKALSKILLLDQQQFQHISLMLFIGTFLISICIESIGWLFKKASIRYG